MPTARLKGDKQGNLSRLVVADLTASELKRVSALPGASVHEADGWISFSLEPNRLTDLRRMLPDLRQSADVLRWYNQWDHKLTASILLRDKPGDAWDVSAIPFGDVLYPYQRTGVAWLRSMRRAVLGDEMGLGKTLQALGAAYDSDPVLVVTVPLAKRAVWADHIARYLPDKRVYVCEGTQPERRKTLEAFTRNGGRGIVVVNHDMFQTRFSSAYRALYTTVWQTVIVDEAHLFQDPRSSRSQGAERIQSKNLYLLTGTPVWNAPESVYGLLRLLDLKRWNSYWAFIYEYCDIAVTPWTRQIVGVKPEKVTQLQQTIGPYVLRRLESDPVVASQLPPLRLQTLTYQLTEEQRAAYRTLKHDYVIKRGTAVIKQEPNPSQMFADLRSLVNDPYLVGLDIEGAKNAMLFDLLDEALSERRKVVLFTWHHNYTKRLLAELIFDKRLRAVALDGTLSEREKLDVLAGFSKPDGPSVLVASIATAGTAIDLTAASVAVFAEGSYVATHIEQAVKRLHRHGQRVDTIIYRLQAERTVEQALWQTVDDRVAQADAMLAFNTFHQRTLEQED